MTQGMEISVDTSQLIKAGQDISAFVSKSLAELDRFEAATKSLFQGGTRKGSVLPLEGAQAQLLSQTGIVQATGKINEQQQELFKVTRSANDAQLAIDRMRSSFQTMMPVAGEFAGRIGKALDIAGREMEAIGRARVPTDGIDRWVSVAEGKIGNVQRAARAVREELSSASMSQTPGGVIRSPLPPPILPQGAFSTGNLQDILKQVQANQELARSEEARSRQAQQRRAQSQQNQEALRNEREAEIRKLEADQQANAAIYQSLRNEAEREKHIRATTRALEQQRDALDRILTLYSSGKLAPMGTAGGGYLSPAAQNALLQSTLVPQGGVLRAPASATSDIYALRDQMIVDEARRMARAPSGQRLLNITQFEAATPHAGAGYIVEPTELGRSIADALRLKWGDALTTGPTRAEGEYTQAISSTMKMLDQELRALSSRLTELQGAAKTPAREAAIRDIEARVGRIEGYKQGIGVVEGRMGFASEVGVQGLGRAASEQVLGQIYKSMHTALGGTAGDATRLAQELMTGLFRPMSTDISRYAASRSLIDPVIEAMDQARPGVGRAMEVLLQQGLVEKLTSKGAALPSYQLTESGQQFRRAIGLATGETALSSFLRDYQAQMRESGEREFKAPARSTLTPELVREIADITGRNADSLNQQLAKFKGIEEAGQALRQVATAEGGKFGTGAGQQLTVREQAAQRLFPAPEAEHLRKAFLSLTEITRTQAGSWETTLRDMGKAISVTKRDIESEAGRRKLGTLAGLGIIDPSQGGVTAAGKYQFPITDSGRALLELRDAFTRTQRGTKVSGEIISEATFAQRFAAAMDQIPAAAKQALAKFTEVQPLSDAQVQQIAARQVEAVAAPTRARAAREAVTPSFGEEADPAEAAAKKAAFQQRLAALKGETAASTATVAAEAENTAATKQAAKAKKKQAESIEADPMDEILRQEAAEEKARLKRQAAEDRAAAKEAADAKKAKAAADKQAAAEAKKAADEEKAAAKEAADAKKAKAAADRAAAAEARKAAAEEKARVAAAAAAPVAPAAATGARFTGGLIALRDRAVAQAEADAAAAAEQAKRDARNARRRELAAQRRAEAEAEAAATAAGGGGGKPPGGTPPAPPTGPGDESEDRNTQATNVNTQQLKTLQAQFEQLIATLRARAAVNRLPFGEEAIEGGGHLRYFQLSPAGKALAGSEGSPLLAHEPKGGVATLGVPAFQQLFEQLGIAPPTRGYLPTSRFTVSEEAKRFTDELDAVAGQIRKALGSVTEIISPAERGVPQFQRAQAHYDETMARIERVQEFLRRTEGLIAGNAPTSAFTRTPTLENIGGKTYRLPPGYTSAAGAPVLMESLGRNRGYNVLPQGLEGELQPGFAKNAAAVQLRVGDMYEEAQRLLASLHASRQQQLTDIAEYRQLVATPQGAARYGALAPHEARPYMLGEVADIERQAAPGIHQALRERIFAEEEAAKLTLADAKEAHRLQLERFYQYTPQGALQASVAGVPPGIQQAQQGVDVATTRRAGLLLQELTGPLEKFIRELQALPRFAETLSGLGARGRAISGLGAEVFGIPGETAGRLAESRAAWQYYSAMPNDPRLGMQGAQAQASAAYFQTKQQADALREQAELLREQQTRGYAAALARGIVASDHLTQSWEELQSVVKAQYTAMQQANARLPAALQQQMPDFGALAPAIQQQFARITAAPAFASNIATGARITTPGFSELGPITPELQALTTALRANTQAQLNETAYAQQTWSQRNQGAAYSPFGGTGGPPIPPGPPTGRMGPFGEFREGWRQGFAPMESGLGHFGDIGMQMGQVTKFTLAYGTAYQVFFSLSQALKQALSDASEFELVMSELSEQLEKSISPTSAFADSLSEISTSAGYEPAVGARLGARAIGFYGVSDQPRLAEMVARESARVATQAGRLSGRTPEQSQQDIAAIVLAFGGATEQMVGDLDTYMTRKFGPPAGATYQTTAQIGAMAAQAGFTLPQTTAMAAAVQAGTGQTSAAVAGLMSQFFAGFSTPQVEQQLSAIGVDLSKSSAEQYAQIVEIWGTLGSDVQEQLANAFGRGRAIGAVRTLFERGNLIQEQARAAEGGAARGELERVFEERMSTFSGVMTQLAGQIGEIFKDLVSLGILDTLGLLAAVALDVAKVFDAFLDVLNAVLNPLGDLGRIAVGLGAAFLFLTRTTAGQRISSAILPYLPGGAAAVARRQAAASSMDIFTSQRGIPFGVLGRVAAIGGAFYGVSKVMSWAEEVKAGIDQINIAMNDIATSANPEEFQSNVDQVIFAIDTQLAESTEFVNVVKQSLSSWFVDFWGALQTAFSGLPGIDMPDPNAELKRRRDLIKQFASTQLELEPSGTDIFGGATSVENIQTGLAQLANEGKSASYTLDLLNTALLNLGNTAEGGLTAFERLSFALAVNSEALSGVAPEKRGEAAAVVADVIMKNVRAQGSAVPAEWARGTPPGETPGIIPPTTGGWNLQGETMTQAGITDFAGELTDKTIDAWVEAGIFPNKEAAEEIKSELMAAIERQLKLFTGEELFSGAEMQALVKDLESLMQRNLDEAMGPGGIEMGAGVDQALQANVDLARTARAQAGDADAYRQANRLVMAAEQRRVRAIVARERRANDLLRAQADSDEEAARIGREYYNRAGEMLMLSGDVEALHDLIADGDQAWVAGLKAIGVAKLGILQGQLKTMQTALQNELRLQLATMSAAGAMYTSAVAFARLYNSPEWIAIQDQIKALGITIESFDFAPVGTGELAERPGAEKETEKETDTPAQIAAAKALAEAKRQQGPVGIAAAQLQVAQADLAAADRNTVAYYNALASVYEAQQELARTITNAHKTNFLLSHDITDPVKQAEATLNEIIERMNALAALGANQDALNELALERRQAEADLERTSFDDRLSRMKTDANLGRITHAAYMQYLYSEKQRLEQISERTHQQQDMLDTIDGLIQDAQDEMSGVWNIGDITLPTPYEVRRYIQQATNGQLDPFINEIGAIVSQEAAGSVVGAQIISRAFNMSVGTFSTGAQIFADAVDKIFAAGGGVANTSAQSVTINVNGGDTAAVTAVLNDYFGQMAVTTTGGAVVR